MSKRFADSEIWNKDWYLDLSIKQKLLVKFLFDNCDCAGFYEISYRTLKNCFGEEITKDDFKELKQIVFVNESVIFIQDFIRFQYGCEISELNPNYSVHKGILKKLNKYGYLETLNQGLDNSTYVELQDKDKDKDIIINNNIVDFNNKITQHSEDKKDSIIKMVDEDKFELLVKTIDKVYGHPFNLLSTSNGVTLKTIFDDKQFELCVEDVLRFFKDYYVWDNGSKPYLDWLFKDSNNWYRVKEACRIKIRSG